MVFEEGWATFIATVREGGKITITKVVRDILSITMGDNVEVRVRKLEKLGKRRELPSTSSASASATA